jgi:restriction system protein
MARRSSQSHTVPPYHQMLWPTLQAIKALGGSGTNQEIEDRAIEIAGYNEEQLSVLHKDGPQIEVRYRMAWARTYLKSVGALENSARSVWSITDYGQTLTEEDMISVPQRYQEKRSQKKGSTAAEQTDITEIASVENDTPPTESPESFESVTFEDWRDKLLYVLQAMPPAKRIDRSLVRA